MSQASIKSLIELQKSGKRLSYKNKILIYIAENPETNEYKIRGHLAVNRATIQGRLSELLDEGLLYVSGTFNDGKNSNYSYEPDKDRQKQNAKSRLIIAYDKWVRSGERFKSLTLNK